MNRDTLRRLLDTMFAIPRWPRTRSTSEIAKLLEEAGHKVHVRSVQRDLLRLESMFGFRCEEEGRTQKWFYPADRKVVDLPAMDGPAALAFLLSREYLNPLLPPATLKLIGPYFSRAEEALREVPGSLAAWRERVCVVPRGPRLLSPKIAPSVQAEVYDAVLGGKQLSIVYRRRGAETEKGQVVHPLGLIVYEGVVYLVAVGGDHKSPVTYTLHRMKSAKQLEAAVVRPEGFKLAEYAHTVMRFPVTDATIRLVARFTPAVAAHLKERPLSADQEVSEGDGYTEVSASVADTDDLRWWLLGFGHHVEVVKPAALRADIKARLTEAAKRYEK
jgi:predicted DNA-binding transcriptional regulator YafY